MWIACQCYACINNVCGPVCSVIGPYMANSLTVLNNTIRAVDPFLASLDSNLTYYQTARANVLPTLPSTIHKCGSPRRQCVSVCLRMCVCVFLCVQNPACREYLEQAG